MHCDLVELESLGKKLYITSICTFTAEQAEHLHYVYAQINTYIRTLACCFPANGKLNYVNSLKWPFLSKRFIIYEANNLKYIISNKMSTDSEYFKTNRPLWRYSIWLCRVQTCRRRDDGVRLKFIIALIAIKPFITLRCLHMLALYRL